MTMTRRAVLLTAAIAAWTGSARTAGSEATMAEALLQAASAGDLAGVKAALASDAALEVRDGEGRTALLLATRADNHAIAALLIEAGADVNARDGIKDTPFLYAGAEGRDAILTTILATGKAKLTDTNRYGGTALIPACHHGHPSTVRILLGTKIDIDHVNNLGWTALLEAVILGDGGPVYQEIVAMLVEARAKNIADGDGRTPLDHARAMGFDKIAALIDAGQKQ